VKKALFLLLFGVACIAAWFYWSPRAAARDLRKAAMTGDVEDLRRLVDFPLVQEQFKADLKANMLRMIDTSQNSGFAGALAAGLGGLMVDGLVTQVVSPSGIADQSVWTQKDVGPCPRPHDREWPDCLGPSPYRPSGPHLYTSKSRPLRIHRYTRTARRTLQ